MEYNKKNDENFDSVFSLNGRTLENGIIYNLNYNNATSWMQENPPNHEN